MDLIKTILTFIKNINNLLSISLDKKLMHYCHFPHLFASSAFAAAGIYLDSTTYATLILFSTCTLLFSTCTLLFSTCTLLYVRARAGCAPCP